MNNNKVFVGLIVVAIIAIIGVFTPVSKVVERVVGAVSTLDGVDSPNVRINDVETAYVSQGIMATSSVLCSIPNPYQASSTLLSFSVRISDGILGANTMTISTSSSYYGSSTPALVFEHTVASNATDFFAWTGNGATSTNSFLATGAASSVLPSVNALTGETYNIIRGGQFVTLRVGTTTGLTTGLADYYDGQCSAIFQKM